jgi:HPt (histidine-containing phosphotransfer) domain-containing protein
VTSERALDPTAFDRLLDFAGGDADFVTELIDTFLEDAVTQLQRMADAARAGAIGELLIASHSLKTNSANVGAMQLSALCRLLEADARSGEVPDAVARVEGAEGAFAAARAELLELRSAS